VMAGGGIEARFGPVLGLGGKGKQKENGEKFKRGMSHGGSVAPISIARQDFKDKP